jgi:hypothetical protein
MSSLAESDHTCDFRYYLYTMDCKSHELHGMVPLWNSAAVCKFHFQRLLTSTLPVFHRLLSPFSDDNNRPAQT